MFNKKINQRISAWIGIVLNDFRKVNDRLDALKDQSDFFEASVHQHNTEINLLWQELNKLKKKFELADAISTKKK
jgi:hypothetical protein